MNEAQNIIYETLQKHDNQPTLFDKTLYNIDNIMDKVYHTFSKNIMLPDFVGIQPMAKPVSLVYLLTETATDTKDDQIELEVISRAVEAKDKTLGLQMSMEILQHIEREVIQATGMEMCIDFHNEYMDLIYRCSTYVDFRIDTEEDPESIVNKIQKACDEVGKNSKRGRANKIILPYELYVHILPYITQQGYFTQSEKINILSDLLHVGTLFGDQEVYSSIRNTLVLVGYKGMSEIDAGIIFCPFQLNPHMKFHSNTYGPAISLTARYGTVIVDNAKDYYVSIQVR